MIKLVLTKTGQEIITVLDQYIDKETETPVGFLFKNPFVVNLIPTGESASTDNPYEFTINYKKWMPCSKDTEFRVAYDYVACVSDPEEQVISNYVQRFGEIINDGTITADDNDTVQSSDSSDSSEGSGLSDSGDRGEGGES
jgi:hypothetical protein